ncbi:UNVERIFIED_CONTAM: hypothetical protein PYX00_008746 [Menopon gallinae]|uniref:folate gamma-glutamyl hydrolase n=1 Tax=Menopon gallinae TaxID=328185 RepID=A0AAW2HPI3_9NEOP
MKAFVYFLFILFLFQAFDITESQPNYRRSTCNVLNNRPIVGVLTQEVTGKLVEYYGNHYAYIASSYVKYLESAGSRVIPIWIGQRKEYYRSILSFVNGVLFPGGATFFNVTGGYAEAGKFIMEVANEFNNQGDYFPIWGTCLGFELMGYIENNMEEIRVDCQSNNQALPLKFKPDFLNSKLFGEAPCDVILTLKSLNATINFHQYCLTEKGMKDAGLLETWKILSINTDENGLEFISTMEHITKPYYAVQFHPEKPAFEWKATHVTPHDAPSIRANQYFADFFVQQARLNCHKFPSETEERKYLIYNFKTTYGIPQSSFTQLYFFDYGPRKTRRIKVDV